MTEARLSFPMDLSLAYRPPRSPLRRFFWRWQICFETIFALSVMETWEKILIRMSPPLVGRRYAYRTNPAMRRVTLMALFLGLLITVIYQYLPYHLQLLYRRTICYLFGTGWTPLLWAEAAVLSTRAPHAYTTEL